MGDIELVRQAVRHPAQVPPTGHFVNPYNFVPLPKVGPQRHAPGGHLDLNDRLSGKIEVRFTAKTP
ncbi:MAG: hypothetical protein ACOYEV_13290 [Candidatus Nanopelagicales bacterium]